MRFAALAMALGAALLIGCQEEARGPTTQEFSDARKELAAKLAKEKGRAKKKAPVAVAKAQQPTGSTFGAVDASFSYDPTGKRDPFRSFEWERIAREQSEVRGPLEQFDLAQLSLVAIVWNSGRARALVEDPSGQGYIVATGTKIGKNDGRVMSIGDNLVVVKETYVDFLGQETTKDIEMRIRRSEGG